MGDELDRQLTSVRARILLRDISEGIARYMSCGDGRIAERLRSFGALRLVDPKRRDSTKSWEITELGERKLKNVR